MRYSAAKHCLIIATMAVSTATLPLSGLAQESLPTNEPTNASTDMPPQSPPPVAQPRFVSDKLVLNVYAEPDQSSARVATIQTGDAVEALERSGNLVRVRLDDGREGWVGANYLVSDAPAAVQLRELQRQQKGTAPRIDKALVEEIAQLKKANTRLKKEGAALRGQVNELQARVTAPSEATADSEGTNETRAPDTATEAAAFAGPAPNGGIWGWLVAMMFVGALSFAGGYQSLARRLRKKFGGLKIY